MCFFTSNHELKYTNDEYKENFNDVFKYLESYNTDNIRFSHVDYNDSDSNVVSYYFNLYPETGQLLFIDIPKNTKGKFFSDTLGINSEFDKLVESAKKIYKKYHK